MPSATNMYAYELLPRLTFLTLTVDNTQEYWEERLEWIGTNDQWLQANKMEQQMYEA